MNIKALINRVLYPKPERVLGIDIRADRIKFAQLDMKNGKKPEVTDYVIMDLPENLRNNTFWENPQDLGNFMGEIINKHGFSTKDCVFTLAGRNAFVRGITMPPMTEAELTQAVLWDSAQYVPYEADTYYVDHAMYGEIDKDGQQPVVLVAAPKNIVDSIVAVGEQLELNILQIDIDVLATYRLIGSTMQNFILFELGRNYSLMTIFQKGAPVAQRSIPGGTIGFAKIIAEKMNVSIGEAIEILRTEALLNNEAIENQATRDAMLAEVDNIVKECRRTTEYYILNKKDASFSNLIVSSNDIIIPGLTAAVNDRIDMKVIPFDVLEKVTFDSRFEKKKVEQNAPSLAVAIGAALAGGDIND
jgi:type IV pilus assembly protein PilM